MTIVTAWRGAVDGARGEEEELPLCGEEGEVVADNTERKNWWCLEKTRNC